MTTSSGGQNANFGFVLSPEGHPGHRETLDMAYEGKDIPKVSAEKAQAMEQRADRLVAELNKLPDTHASARRWAGPHGDWIMYEKDGTPRKDVFTPEQFEKYGTNSKVSISVSHTKNATKENATERAAWWDRSISKMEELQGGEGPKPSQMPLLKTPEGKYTVKKGTTLYHATSDENFKGFEPHIAWFTPSPKEHQGYLENVAGQTITGKFQGGNIATEKDWAPIAKEIFKTDEPIYSMFDESVGEFKKADVQKFIKRLQDEGYDGAVINDYSAVDQQKDAHTLALFNPQKSLGEVAGPKPSRMPDHVVLEGMGTAVQKELQSKGAINEVGQISGSKLEQLASDLGISKLHYNADITASHSLNFSHEWYNQMVDWYKDRATELRAQALPPSAKFKASTPEQTQAWAEERADKILRDAAYDIKNISKEDADRMIDAIKTGDNQIYYGPSSDKNEHMHEIMHTLLWKELGADITAGKVTEDHIIQLLKDTHEKFKKTRGLYEAEVKTNDPMAYTHHEQLLDWFTNSHEYYTELFTQYHSGNITPGSPSAKLVEAVERNSKDPKVRALVGTILGTVLMYNILQNQAQEGEPNDRKVDNSDKGARAPDLGPRRISGGALGALGVGRVSGSQGPA